MDLREVLALYGIGGARVAPLPGGMVNVNFRVDAPEGAFALKWYRPWLRESQPERLRFVCETQAAMHAAGVPAPAIVPGPDGNLFVEAEAGNFVLSEFVEGRQYARGRMPPGCAAAMGAELHLLFEALSETRVPEQRSLMTLEAALARVEDLLRLAGQRDGPVDRKAVVLLEHRRRGLEAWVGPPPELGRQQCIHGDYQDTNVIFDDKDEVAAILDWDALNQAGRAYEVMRAFNFSFPEGAAGGMEFLRGYVSAARPSPEAAAALVDVWSYTTLQRFWPMDARYEQPESYQERWDVFSREPSGWWEGNRERIRQELVRFARAAAGRG
jgi:Ser/Thr protein kinase RdoA (MazF antagonist)